MTRAEAERFAELEKRMAAIEEHQREQTGLLTSIVRIFERVTEPPPDTGQRPKSAHGDRHLHLVREQ